MFMFRWWLKASKSFAQNVVSCLAIKFDSPTRKKNRSKNLKNNVK